jgi:hypothetical protein
VQRRVTTAELRQALSGGVLPPSTLVWREGQPAWAPASTFAELMAASRAPSDAAAADRVTPTDVAPPPESAPAPGAARAAMRTLTGLSAPGGPARRRPSPPKKPPAPTPAAPIVVPSAQRAPARAAVTQQPSYAALPRESSLPAIPQAPRIPKDGAGKAKPRLQLADQSGRARASDIDELWDDFPGETATQVRPYTPAKPAAAPPAERDAAKPALPHDRLDPRPSLVRRPPPPPQRPSSKKTDRPPSVVMGAPLPSAAAAASDVVVAASDDAVASGNAVVASGNAAVASGNDAVASGNDAVASGNDAVASGNAAVASGNAAVASGNAAVASRDAAVASRDAAVATGNAAVASGNAAVATENGAVARRGRAPHGLDEPIAVPLSSMVVAGSALMALIIGAFFFGRCSNDAPALTARRGLGALPLIARQLTPEPPKPCWVARQPVRWAPEVSKSIPFKVRPLATTGFFVGYARDDNEAVGVEIDAKSGKIQGRFSKKTEAEIDRVTPSVLDQAATFHVSTTKDALSSAIPVGTAGLIVGLARDGVGVVRAPGQAPTAAFRLDPAEASALRVLSTGASGYAVTLRREGAIWTGWLDAAGQARGALTKVQDSGGSVGKPMAGWNGAELALVFADRPKDAASWTIRTGHAPAGESIKATRVFELPKGGPGGDAFAPDIVGLADGRWIVVWTEGTPGARAIRAQTFDRDLAAVGDPIALSPPAGNFGQGVLGVAGAYATVVFLSKGASSYELWGAILQCG